MLYFHAMWPFTRRRERKKKLVEKIVVGLIIGGAIGSIIGKTMMEKHEEDKGKKGLRR